METFGARLRALRQQRGWSQDALAAAIGLRRNTSISTWERAQYPPSHATVARLARALHVSVEDLLRNVPVGPVEAPAPTGDVEFPVLSTDALAVAALLDTFPPADRAELRARFIDHMQQASRRGLQRPSASQDSG